MHWQNNKSMRVELMVTALAIIGGAVGLIVIAAVAFWAWISSMKNWN
jgi:hypothetical protein